MNYEPFIERDLAAIPATVAAFRSTHTAEETWTEVTRFAVLAFAPSQHSRHALLACLSVWDLREELAHINDQFDRAVVECATYAAASRQPWSEPPMLDPPRIPSDQRVDRDELREAIAASDRLRAERWLACRFGDDDFLLDYFAAAAANLDDLGHNVIVGNAAVRLAAILGDRGRYAMLRVGLWEMVARGSGKGEAGVAENVDLRTLCRALVSRIAANDGEIIAVHALFLFDAALQTGNDMVIRRVATDLSVSLEVAVAAVPAAPHVPPPAPAAYRFARDYGSCLKAHAVAKRLRPRFPDVDFDGMLAAVHRNLQNAPAVEEMMFA